MIMYLPFLSLSVECKEQEHAYWRVRKQGCLLCFLESKQSKFGCCTLFSWSCIMYLDAPTTESSSQQCDRKQMLVSMIQGLYSKPNVPFSSTERIRKNCSNLHLTYPFHLLYTHICSYALNLTVLFHLWLPYVFYDCTPMHKVLNAKCTSHIV
jgi:hypothetical protein